MAREEFIKTTAIEKMQALTAKKRGIQGGTSSGKTFGILPILIDYATSYEILEISVVSESLPHLKKGAIKDFKKIMFMTGRGFRWDEAWHGTDCKYTFENGSFIEFFSVQNESKVRGMRRDILYINECNNVVFETYNQLAIRTKHQIWLDFNPVSRFWFHEEVQPNDDCQTIVLTYKDNEALHQSIIDELMLAQKKADEGSEYWKNWCKVYIEGQIGSLEGTCISNWNTISSVPEGAKYLGSGMDFGFTNDPSTLVDIYRFNNQLIYDEVLYQKGVKTGVIAKTIQDFHEKRKVAADSASPRTIDDIKDYGVNMVGARKGRNSINAGIELLNEQGMLVTERSTNLINELRHYIYKKDRDGNNTNEPIDAYNHIIDACRYGTEMYAKLIRPTRRRIIVNR